MISSEITLIKNPKTQTFRTSFDEICEESSISQPHHSLFLATFATLFEIILRFENEFNLGIRTSLRQKIIIQIEKLEKGFQEYFMKFLSIITDFSTYDLATRKNYLNGYLAREDITRTFSFMMQKILILNLPSYEEKISSFLIDRNLAELCLKKVSEIFSLATTLIFEDGTPKQLKNPGQKCPLAYFFLTNQAEVIILYTKSMVDENNFELNKLVSGPGFGDLVKSLESQYEGNNLNRNQSENFQSLQAFKNVTENFSKPKSVYGETPLMNKSGKFGQNNVKLPPPVLLPKRKQEEEVKDSKKTRGNLSLSSSFETSSIEIKGVRKIEKTLLRPELPADIVQYISYVGELISKNKLYDKKLQELTVDLVGKFPEVGKNTERLICSVNEPLKAENLLPVGFLTIPNRPSFQSGPALKLFPNPPTNPNPLLSTSKIFLPKPISPSVSQNFSIPKTKICSFSSKPEPEDLFSGINCLKCLNTICNKCRLADTKSCVNCKRQYNESEIRLLKNISLSMNFQMEKPVIFEEEEKQEQEVKKSEPISDLQLRRSTRKFQSFRKCNEHMAIIDEELFNKEFKCAETCGVCNECRIKSMQECIKCKRVYNDDEKDLIQMISISMKGS